MTAVARVLREAALWVTAVLGSVSILMAVAAVAFGITPLIFRSGSMSPEIPTGSLGLAQTVDASTIRVGDVVSAVWSDGTRVTHRVVGVESMGGGAVRFETRGDANQEADVEQPILTEADRVFFAIPGAGYAFQEVTKPYWVFGAGVVVGAIVMLTVVRPRARPEEADDAEPAEPAAQSLAPPRHAAISAGRHRRGAVTAGVVAGVLLLPLALLPAPTGTLAAFNDASTAQATYATGTVPNATNVQCAVTGTLTRTLTISWTAPTGGLGPITGYTVTGSDGFSQTVSTTSVSRTVSLLSIGTTTYTIRSNYGATPWLSSGAAVNFNVLTGLLWSCTAP